MKRQQKLTFLIEKRRAVEPPEKDEGPEKDGERSEESAISVTKLEVNFMSQLPKHDLKLSLQ